MRSLGKCTKPAREQARNDRTDQGRGIVEKELMNGRVAEEMTEERKDVRRAPSAAHLIGKVGRTKEALESTARAKAKAKGKCENLCCYDCGEQGHVGVNCPYKRTNGIDEEEDQMLVLGK